MSHLHDTLVDTEREEKENFEVMEAEFQEKQTKTYSERIEEEIKDMTNEEKKAFLAGVSFGNKDTYETSQRIIHEVIK